MSLDFVRYSPQIETIDPDIDDLVTEIIGFWEKKVGESPTTEGSGRAVRGAHAKTFGIVKAEVEILSDAPAPYAQGIYAEPGRHDALIRFSSSSGHLGPDAALGTGQGLAIKIFDIGGAKLVDGEEDSTTFDLVLKNNPIFIANTARHYVLFEGIVDDVPKYFARGKAGFHQLLTDYLTGKGALEQADWAWDELLAFLRVAQVPMSNPVLTTFWTMGAVRHGDHVAKVRLAPAAESAARSMHPELELESDADVFRHALVDELKADAFDFDLQAQLCTDLEKMPVNELTVEWPEKLSPFVTVGRVHLPQQDVAKNFEPGDALSFNQWRVTAEHRPLGEIMEVRRIYSAAAKVRRTLNGQPQTEPASADEALASPELDKA